MIVFKPQSPFENLKKKSQSADENIIKAIVMQAIIDATNTKFDDKNRIKALKWFYSEEFKKYCELINQDYLCVISKIFNIIHNFYQSHKI